MAVCLIAVFAMSAVAFAATAAEYPAPGGSVVGAPAVVSVDVLGAAALNAKTAVITINGTAKKTFVLQGVAGHWASTQVLVGSTYKTTWLWTADADSSKATVFCYTDSTASQAVALTVTDNTGAVTTDSWSFTVAPGSVYIPPAPGGTTDNAATNTACIGCHHAGSSTAGAFAQDYATDVAMGPNCVRCHVTSASVPPHHGPGAVCATCHTNEARLWSSSADLHAAPAAAVLTNPDHNTAEQLVDECLQCHSMFQRPLGVAAFVTPIDQTGVAPFDSITGQGTWNLLPAASQWRATKCEVCHDPSSTAPAKLAKYGAWLDGGFDASYIPLDTGMPTAYNYVWSAGAYTQTDYANQSALSVTATKLCDSCHGADDQGADPNAVKGANDYGPQGGDSRSYVTANHAEFGCTDCHKTHDFTPIADPRTDAGCNGTGCHVLSGPATLGGVDDPGVVHTNHMP
jgi:hypothetical protein